MRLRLTALLLVAAFAPALIAANPQAATAPPACPTNAPPQTVDEARKLLVQPPGSACSTGTDADCIKNTTTLAAKVVALQQILQYCAAHADKAGTYDRTWYATEAANWQPLVEDIAANGAAILDGTYQPPQDWGPPVHIAPSAYAGDPYLRGLLGGSFSGASGTDPQGKLLIDIFADLPLIRPQKAAGPSAHSLRAWGYLRIGSIGNPQSIVSASQLAAAYAATTSLPASQVVQSFEMSAGLAWQFFTTRSDPHNIFEKATFAVIAGGGALTPVSPGQTQPQYFALSNDVVTAYNPKIPAACQPTGTPPGYPTTCLLEIYAQDRSRFFREYEGGLRLKVYPRTTPNHAAQFPALFDFTVGQNEYVTGGKFQGTVLHLGGAGPLYIPGLYLFGAMDVALATSADQPGPLLVPATFVSTDTIVPVTQTAPNRDRYTIGFGLDIAGLLRNHVLQDALNKAH